MLQGLFITSPWAQDTCVGRQWWVGLCYESVETRIMQDLLSVTYSVFIITLLRCSSKDKDQEFDLQVRADLLTSSGHFKWFFSKALTTALKLSVKKTTLHVLLTNYPDNLVISGFLSQQKDALSFLPSSAQTSILPCISPVESPGGVLASGELRQSKDWVTQDSPSQSHRQNPKLCDDKLIIHVVYCIQANGAAWLRKSFRMLRLPAASKYLGIIIIAIKKKPVTLVLS